MSELKWAKGWQKLVLGDEPFANHLKNVGDKLLNKVEARTFTDYPGHGMNFAYGSYFIEGGDYGGTFVLWPTAPFTDGHDGKTHHQERVESEAQSLGLKKKGR